MWGEGEGVSAEGSEADQGRDGVSECGKRLFFRQLSNNQPHAPRSYAGSSDFQSNKALIKLKMYEMIFKTKISS